VESLVSNVIGTSFMNTQHVLRIRWDIPYASWPVDRGRAFQQYRWKLFTRFTLPSLQRQRVPWLAWLWADPKLSAFHEELSLPDSRVRFVYDLDHAAKSMAEAQAERAFVIGRIDSDDMLAPETLDIVGQTRHADAARPFLQLFSGCAYDERRNRVLPWRNPSPAFVFRSVTGSDLAGGFPSLGGKHSHVHEASIHIRTPAPAFCVVLHGRNLSNGPEAEYAKGRLPRLLDSDARERFGLPKRSGVLMNLVRAWT
jgi:hypothetical protein